MSAVTELLPGLATVECPVCRHQVGLPYSRELVPFHWLRPVVYQNRVACPGEGAQVRVSGSGLVAVLPEPTGEVTG